MFVCAKCERQMRPKKNGLAFVEMAGRGTDAAPYKLWMGDLWECQDCGAEMIYTAATQKPVSEHYEPDFSQKCQRYEAKHVCREFTRGA